MKPKFTFVTVALACFLAAAGKSTAAVELTESVKESSKDKTTSELPIYVGDGGDFTLMAPVTYPLSNGSFVDSVAIGDVSGDGRNDVVVSIIRSNAPEAAYSVVVFVQGTNGLLTQSFRRQTEIAVATAMPVKIVDLDRAYGLDVVIGWAGGLVSMLSDPNNLLGAPLSFHSGEVAMALAPIELTGDGYKDIVSLAWTPAGRTYFSNGVGGFRNSERLETQVGGYNYLTHGDINGDGREDAVVGSWQVAPPQIRMHFQNDSSGFVAGPTVTSPANAVLPVNGLGLADYNGDDRLDLAFTWGGNLPNVGLRIMFQDQQGGFVEYRDYPTFDSPGELSAADINLDGRGDVIVNHFTTMGVYLQSPSNELRAEQATPSPSLTGLSVKALMSATLTATAVRMSLSQARSTMASL